MIAGAGGRFDPPTITARVGSIDSATWGRSHAFENIQSACPRRSLEQAGDATAKLIRFDGLDDSQIYATIGEDGFHRLVGLFYRQVPQDDILGPMYPKADLAAAEERLRDFLVGRFGGPTRYIEQRGHPRLRMRHAPFPINREARDRWMQLMTRALDEARLPADVTRVPARLLRRASRR